MPQVFHPSANSFAKASVAGVGLSLVALIFVAIFVQRSPYLTRVNEAQLQPIPFSHKHHAGELGIDCRYCHNSVEKSSFAGMPATEVCMTCHSQIWRDSPMLAPLRASYAAHRAVAWERVHDVPDYAFFQHDIHVAKGVACETCHGRVDQMPLTWKANTLHMEWCLKCHREPERFIRSKEHVFDMGYVADKSAELSGPKLAEAYHVPLTRNSDQRLTDCVTCHR